MARLRKARKRRIDGRHLLLAAICKGVARWEPFTAAGLEPPVRGEVCCNGLRCATYLDEVTGCPVVHSVIRAELERALMAAMPAASERIER